MATSATESADVSGSEPDDASDEEVGRGRLWAVLAVLPFLAIGLADVVLLLTWGIDPLWGFAILPPILFCSVLAYLVFSTDFLEGRT
ncbi:hypothetical protein [Halobaculum gomorrense]|uniref:DUF8142 domain-containing protein n=1 Tax=Halobaculum gomorrense TaxID=43928 RepID=A0A1M5UME5_9EURY|nr:hypothetical protein [Halobaculum gomorrense]SHH64149.1 hypothetical protein SAMN05443636_3071 [Halobaculum gomorrense]